MKIDLNDPKLTAFALGELQGREAEQMANLIEKDPAAKKHVEEIRETAAFLSGELKNEANSDRLTVAERETIFTGLAKPWWRNFKIAIPAVAAGAAATIALVQTLSVREIEKQTQMQAPTAVVSEGKIADKADPAKTSQLNNVAAAPPPPAQEVAAADYQAEQETALTEEADYSDEGADIAAAAPSSFALSQSRGKVAYGDATGSGIRHSFVMEKQKGGPHLSQIEESNTERYSHIKENEFIRVADEPLSTFSTDVDTAAYANVRRFLTSGQLPPKDAVRTEEMLNYFKYNYPEPKGQHPFSVTTEMAIAPWNSKTQIVRIGLRGKEVAAHARPATNLVFLLDVSGSMMDENKLPLVQKSMKLLVEQMRPKDRIAIVVYAGSEGIALPSTSGSQKKKILEAIEGLSAGGSTNGAAGINAAYKLAQEHFIQGGINRVILATDGDFNVGVTSEGELIRLIEEKAKTGVFLSVLGFGSGNYNDSTMVKLAGKGNGNYAYIDTLREAEKVLGSQAGGTLQTIAKDVKIQVEFNPKHVEAYRLIGYEKRMLNKEDFNDDTKDAGEIGAGHTVTALYELVPKGGTIPGAKPSVDPLKYQEGTKLNASASDELLTVKLRYKKPEGKTSTMFDVPMKNDLREFDQASADLRFASSVAGFAMVLRDSPLKGEMNFGAVLDIARNSTRIDGKVDEMREEFVDLVKKARDIKKK